MKKNNDFSDFLGFLNETKTEYMIVGGYAANYHGYSRFTSDLDIFIKPSEENSKKVLGALKKFIDPNLKENWMNEILKNKEIIQMGIPPARIDILNDISGLTWEQASRNVKKDSYYGIPISYIGLDELIRNKEAAGREKDIRDVKELKSINDLFFDKKICIADPFKEMEREKNNINEIDRDIGIDL